MARHDSLMHHILWFGKHQTELSTGGQACSLVIVKNKAVEISAHRVRGRGQWETSRALTAGLFCWIGGRLVLLFIPSPFSFTIMKPLQVYCQKPIKKTKEKQSNYVPTCWMFYVLFIFYILSTTKCFGVNWKMRDKSFTETELAEIITSCWFSQIHL